MAVALVQQAHGGAVLNPAVAIAQPANGNILVVITEGFANSSAVACTGVTFGQHPLSIVGDANHEDFDVWIGVVGPGAGTSVSTTIANANNAVMVLEFSGVTSVQDAVATHLNESAGTTTTIAPSITTVTPGCLVVIFATAHFTTVPTGTPSGAGGWTDLVVANTDTDNILRAAYLVPAGAGAQSGTWTWALGQFTDGGAIALQPAAVVPSGPAVVLPPHSILGGLH